MQRALSLKRVLEELISTGFRVGVAAERLGVDKSLVEAALETLLAHRYVVKLEEKPSCVKCPLRGVCATSRPSGAYIVTRKGLRLLRGRV